MHFSEIVVNKDYEGLNPVIFGREVCEKDHSYGPAVRSYFLIHYVVSGCGIFEAEGEKHKIESGEMFVIKPGQETFYKADSSDPWTYIWIGFTSKTELPFPLKPKIRCPEALPIFNEMQNCANMENGRSAFLTARLWDLMSLLLESDKASDDYIDKALSCMNAEYMTGLNVSQIAHRINLDRTYFFRLFKERVGVSPSEYLFNLRMEKAKELMIKNGESPTTAAASVGYSDIYNFSKMFKKKYGLSPREYKKTLPK